MCISIAPDCGGSGSGILIPAPQISPEVKPILYAERHIETPTEQPNLGTNTDDDTRRRYGTFSRNRFFDRNETDNLWPQRATTPDPNWELSSANPVVNQFAPSTDSGN